MYRSLWAALLVLVARAALAAGSLTLLGVGSLPNVTPAYSWVKSNAITVFSGTTASTTLAGVTAGNAILIVSCGITNLATSGVTVGGVAATLMGTTSTGNNTTCTGSYRRNVGAGSNTITATFSGTCAGCFVLAEEYSGLAASGALDGQSATYTADGTAGTNLPAGSFTTTVNNDMIWVVIFQSQNVTPTLDTGYSAGSVGVGSTWWSEYKTQPSAGAINPKFVSGTGAFDNSVTAAALK